MHWRKFCVQGSGLEVNNHVGVMQVFLFGTGHRGLTSEYPNEEEAVCTKATQNV